MANKKICGVESCGKPCHAKGYCGTHYRRLISHGLPTRKYERQGLAFFEEALIYDGDACILWPYGKTSRGYGALSIGQKHKAVHREVCFRIHGEPLSPGLVARHLCGVRACVSPRHIVWGTVKENMHDKIRHGTAQRGASCARSKLTEDNVRWIREFGASLPQKELAKMFGVTRGAIGHVLNRTAWLWLP